MSEKSSLAAAICLCATFLIRNRHVCVCVCTVRTGNLFMHTHGGKSNLTHIQQPFLFVCMYTVRGDDELSIAAIINSNALLAERQIANDYVINYTPLP
jgi:hypothetical protein